MPDTDGITDILQDIDVSIVRVEVKSTAGETEWRAARPHKRRSSPLYVFAIQPVQQSLRRTTEPSQRTRATIANSARTAAQPQECAIEVRRTYSECRRLYQDLLQLTNCAHRNACACTMGACPFWTMYLLLQAFFFPRKRYRFWQRSSSSVLDERTRALNLFMKCVFYKLHLYREDFFAAQNELYAGQRPPCKVLNRLEGFLDLRDEVIVQLKAIDARVHRKLNLRGWQSDRKNLYFADEAAPQEESSQKPTCAALFTFPDSSRSTCLTASLATSIDSEEDHS